VKAIEIIQNAGAEIHWAGDEIVAVAAVDESTAEDAVRAIKVEYEKLPHFVKEQDLAKAPANRPEPSDQTKGTPEAAMKEAEVILEGTYGNEIITHCCLESHGSVMEWEGEDKVLVHPSTQFVSGYHNEVSKNLSLPASNVRVKMDHVGGGFGSKFGPDRWDIAAARLSKKAGGKAVKMMLERDAELTVAGSRPSGFARIKVGATKDGRLLVWQSETWGTSGQPAAARPNNPYVFEAGIPHYFRRHHSIPTNMARSRAWRAPNHPQGCVITMGALDDLAAKLNMDPLDFFIKNIDMTGPRANTYKDELLKAAEMIEWKKLWRPRGEGAVGSTKTVKRGLGLSIHQWGGGGHNSDCDVTIQPDGTVETKLGSQDLGTGTRTVLRIVTAETMGIPLESVNVLIGDNRYAFSGGSGGSTTVGGVAASTRRASVDALNTLLEKVAPSLNTTADKLEAVGGKIQIKGDASKSMTWKQACAKLGTQSITARGKQPGAETLTQPGVGGAQMADVSVDIETGIVKMNNFVAAQDCGLIIDMKTAESQVYGAMIMGVCYALYEERIMDEITGRVLNPNMEFYKLAGLADIGQFKVHMMTGKGYDERGVIGLGEPPTVSPGAAIANAVANAIGVRVGTIPLTPDRVLAALEKKGGSNAKI